MAAATQPEPRAQKTLSPFLSVTLTYVWSRWYLRSCADGGGNNSG